MKKQLAKLSALAVAVTLFSCSKDDPAPIITPVVIPTITDAEMAADIQADLELDQAAEAGLVIQQNLEYKAHQLANGSPTTNGRLVSEACQVSGELEKDQVEFNGKLYFSRIYDFGTTGCTQPSGVTVKGVIKILALTAKFNDVVVLFQDYDMNGRIVNGSIHLVKNEGINNPNITNTQNLTVKLPVLGTFKREGTITRIYTKGYDTPDNYTDDFFKTTGTWTTTFPNMTTNKATITKAILTSTECTRKHIEGTINFVRNLNTGTIDFGDGQGCSQTWKITRNGKSFEVNVNK